MPGVGGGKKKKQKHLLKLTELVGYPEHPEPVYQAPQHTGSSSLCCDPTVGQKVLKTPTRDFPGGTAVSNPPSNAGTQVQSLVGELMLRGNYRRPHIASKTQQSQK